MNGSGRRLQRREHRPADVLDMDQGAPRRAVALDQDFTAQIRVADQAVDHQVRAQLGRGAIGRCIAQVDGRETGVRELRQGRFAADLGFAVWRHRVEFRLFVQHVIRACRPVDRAGGREHEPRHACRLGSTPQNHRGIGVDVIGAGRVDIPHRVVGQAREMNNPVRAVEIGSRDRADILADDPVRARHVRQRAFFEVEGIEAGYLMPAFLEKTNQHGPDIAIVACNKNSHAKNP